MTVRICVRARGPLVVEGDVELLDPEGVPISLEGKKRIMLCRCGASASRPFCDGTHYRNGFDAPPRDSSSEVE